MLRYISLFILFALVGFITSRSVTSALGNFLDANAPRMEATKENKISYPIPNLAETLPTEASLVPSDAQTKEAISKPIQENVLVILVDNIKKENPTIEGVWLLLYFTDSAHLTLMPIYPSLNNNEDRSLTKLFEKAYNNKGDGIPGDKFFTSLKEKRIWWSGYLILDHTSLLAMFDIATQGNGTSTDFTIENDHLIILASAREHPQESLHEQTTLIQGFCQQLSIPPSPFDYSRFPSDILEHLRSDLDLAAFFESWNKRISLSGQLSCEFPHLIIK